MKYATKIIALLFCLLFFSFKSQTLERVKTIGYSNKARTISLERLKTLSKQAIETLVLNMEEKLFCKPADYSNLDFHFNYEAINKKNEDADELTALRLEEIKLNIK